MHITITGNLGSGKSTVCKYLSQKYGFEKYSTGDVQRALAQRMGMTTLELNLFMQDNPQYDRLIDDEVVKISEEKQGEDVIFDSRMAWHFVQKSFKVFLLVDTYVAAERVFKDSRGDVEVYTSVEDALEKLKERAASESERFRSFYHVDYFDLANYDLVVDTSICTPELIAEVICSEAKSYYENEQYAAKVLLSPQSIYPGPDFDEAEEPEEFEHLTIENLERLIVNKHFGTTTYVDINLKVVKYRDCFFIINELCWLDGLNESEKYAEITLLYHILRKTPFVSVRIIADKPKDTIEPFFTLERYISKISRNDIFNFEICGRFFYRHHPDFLKN